MTEVPANERSILLPADVVDSLPSMIRVEVAKLSAREQSAFLEEFERRKKSTGTAYFASLLFCHYAYIGRWGLTLFMWVLALVSYGVIGIVWWFIDLFRIPGLVKNYNKNVAISVMRDIQSTRT